MFSGGQAKLVLCDKENLLESGVEIVACPPGKKPQNMMLLSSGERALTAIAFLMSLLKHKPSPIVILDELDAPLDERNVEKGGQPIGGVLRLLTVPGGYSQPKNHGIRRPALRCDHD